MVFWFFWGWSQALAGLFILAISFYIASLTFVIWLHPLLCLLMLIKRRKHQAPYQRLVSHLVWSPALAVSFLALIVNGYVITV